MNRRQFLALGATASIGGLAGCTLSSEVESQRDAGPTVGLEPVVDGLTFPTAMTFLPTGDRLIAERFGQVLRHTASGAIEPVVDLTDQLASLGGEKGVLGLALHPDFETNRHFYVRYSGARAEDDEYSHDAVLSEFTLTPDMDGLVPESERRILTVPQPGMLHNAGDIAFGPDGYLYVPLGDGQRTDTAHRTATDGDAFWWYEQGQAAQNTRDNLLGGILRIDVDTTDGERAYGIPPDNPLVGREGRDEYYAWGLRNPYRISFDGDDLFIADVGEHIREAVYLGESGVNYGWPIFEGSTCGAAVSLGHTLRENPLNALNPKTWVAQTNRISPVKVCPASDELDGTVSDPVIEYHRAGARAVTGGYVYRGDAVPELAGQYVFGDYISPSPLFAVAPDTSGDQPWPMAELTVSGTDDGRLSDLLVSFARDPQGELYVLTTRGSDGTGQVRKIVGSE